MSLPPVPVRPLPLGAFELVEPLAHGAMGEVWRARRREIGGIVAIKLLHGSGLRDWWSREAFANEARSVAGMNHPGIIRIFEHGLVDGATADLSGGLLLEGSPYLAMQYVAGQPLHHLAGQLDWGTLQDVLLQVLAALAHSHSHGVIHRDIKPGNVLMERVEGDAGELLGWRAILTDFGLAHISDRKPSAERVVAGTPAYIAPEQLAGDWRDQGPWTDLYSLGCLAWAMATGQPPFGRGRSFAEISHEHMHRQPPAFEPVMQVPDELEPWLRRLLQKRPDERYERAADAAAALRGLGPPSARPSLAVMPEGATLPAATTRVESAESGRPAGGSGSLPLELSTARLAEALPIASWGPPPEPFPAGPILPRSRAPTPPSWGQSEARELEEGPVEWGSGAPPLQGRRAERDLLWAALRRVEAEGRASVVILRGSGGTGKSRLADWLCQRAHEVGAAHVMRAWHSAAGGGPTGLAAMFGRHLRCQGLGRMEVVERLHRALPGRARLHPDEVHAIAEMLAPASAEDVSHGARVIRFRDLRERQVLSTRLLSRAAGEGDCRRPVLMWLDDVQWSPDSLDFLRHLLDQREESPVPVLALLTVGELRRERQRMGHAMVELMARPHVEVLDIGALEAESHRALVATLLGGPSETAWRIAAATRGNPLFAVQLVADLVTRGRLLRQRGVLAAPEQLVLPVSLEEVWRSRVETLLAQRSGAENRALELAAVLGDKIDPDEWRAACSFLEAEPSAALVDALIEGRLAHPDPEGGSGWSFVHPLLRESLIYRADEPGLLVSMHRACARMLQERAQPHRGTQERVAQHLLGAGQRSAALGPLLVAAREAYAEGDYASAERILELREETMRQVPLPDADAEWGEGQLLRLRIYRMWARHAEARALGDRLVASADLHGWVRIRAWAQREMAVVDYHQGAPVRAWRSLRQAEDAAQDLGDRSLLAACRQEMGRFLVERANLDAAVHQLELARQDYALVQDGQGQADCSWLLGRVAKQSGDLGLAMSRFSESLDAFEQMGHRWGVARCTNELGEIARLQGDLESAELLYRDALDRMMELGCDDVAVVRMNLGIVLQDHGRYEEAGTQIEVALQSWMRSGHRAMIGTAHVLLLSCAASAGEWDHWDRHLGSAMQGLAETGFVDRDVAAAAHRAGELAWRAGQQARARVILSLAAAQWRALDRPRELAEATARLEEA